MFQAGLSQVLWFSADAQATVLLRHKARKHIRVQCLCQTESSGLSEIAACARQTGILIPDSTEILRGKCHRWAAAQIENDVVEFQRKGRHAAIRKQPARSEVCPQTVGDEAVSEREGIIPSCQLHRGGESRHAAVIQNENISAGAAERVQQLAQIADFGKFSVIVRPECAAETVGFRSLAAQNAIFDHDIREADANGVKIERLTRAAQLLRRMSEKINLLKDGL